MKFQRIRLETKNFDYLQGSRLLSFSNGLHKRGGGKRLDTAVPQTSGGRAIPEQLKRLLRNITIQSKNRGHIDYLQVSPQIIDHHRRSGAASLRRRFEHPLQLGQVAGKGERGVGENRVGLKRPGGEGCDEAGGLEGVFVVVLCLGEDRIGEVGGD